MLIPGLDNISIKGKGNKVYDQNMIIYGFNELKEKLGDENKDLYGKLVRLAVIQSGLTNSPIAFTNLLPYDDFREFYNQTLSNLENIPNLADFKTLDIMERSSGIILMLLLTRKESYKKANQLQEDGFIQRNNS